MKVVMKNPSCHIVIALIILLIQQVSAADNNSNTNNGNNKAGNSNNNQGSRGNPISDVTRSNNHNLPPPPTRPVIQHSGWKELPRPLPANSNFYTLSSVQRRRHTLRFQAPKDQKNKRQTDGSPAPIGKMEKIMIPIGVSHYKPIQFVDAIKFKRGDFSRIPPPVRDNTNIHRSSNNQESNARNNQKRDNNQERRFELPPMLPRPAPVGSVENTSIRDRSVNIQNNNKRAIETNSTSNASNEDNVSINDSSNEDNRINKIETVEDVDNSLNNGGVHTEHGFVHKPRMIELESSYIPLTLRFSTRPRRLNIIHHDDLIGQDSNRHDRINGRVDPSQPIDILDPHSGISNLDTRAIFGQSRKEEPIILKQGTNTRIPSNMQSIIKCVFPDFRFEGFEKVRSAC